MVLEEHDPEVEGIGAAVSSPSPCIGEEGGDGVGEGDGMDVVEGGV
jgi:hypothetical protein